MLYFRLFLTHQGRGLLFPLSAAVGAEEAACTLMSFGYRPRISLLWMHLEN